MANLEITMCLCNYARREQMDDLITRLCAQTCKPRIFVWNNDTHTPFQDDRVEWVINSNRNMHTRHVIYLWHEATTAFVGRMDDDLYPADDHVLADALSIAKKFQHPEQMLGAYGVRLYRGKPYEHGHHINIPKGHGQILKDGKVSADYNNLHVDLLKGRFLLMRQTGTLGLRVDFRHYHTDMYISTALAERRRLFHVVGGCFFGRENLDDSAECQGRLRDYDIDDLGYCARPAHIMTRNVLSIEWASQCFPDSRVKDYPGEQEES